MWLDCSFRNCLICIAGFGPIQFIILITCSLGIIYFIAEMTGFSILALSIGCEFLFIKGEMPVIITSTIVGLLFTGLYAGYKTDHIGRRTMFLYSISLSMISSFGSAMMPNFYLIVVWRFLTGLW